MRRYVVVRAFGNKKIIARGQIRKLDDFVPIYDAINQAWERGEIYLDEISSIRRHLDYEFKKFSDKYTDEFLETSKIVLKRLVSS